MKNLLFNSIHQIKAYVEISSNTKLENYQPAMILVQEKWLIPIIGKAAMDQVITKLKTDDFNSVEREFLEALRFPAAILCQYFAIGSNNISLTDGGFTVPAGDKVAVASQWRVDDYRAKLEMDSQLALDKLLEWLQEKGDQISSYQGSDAQKRNSGMILSKASDFQQYTTLQIGHFMFHKLLPMISMVEETVIRTAICDELFDHIKTTLKDGGDLAEYKPLMDYLKPIVAYFTLSDSIEEMNLSTSGDNLIIKYRDPSSNQSSGKKELEESRIIRLMARNKRLGADAINRLQRHLSASAADYPIYQDSECNPASILMETTEHDNSSGSGIML